MPNLLVIIFASIVGLLALFAIFVLCYVLFLIYRRRRAVNSALERRQQRLLSEQQEEQVAWRRQRLRQVVVLLLQKGIVEEGIPIGFQLPGGHREVHARRDLSRMHHNRADRLRENLSREMDETLDPRVRSVLQTPLHLLLEGGRPPEALHGPDVLQLLLLDREDFVRQNQMLSDSESESDRETVDETRLNLDKEEEEEDSLTHFLYGVTTRPLPEVMEEDFHVQRLSRQVTSLSLDEEAAPQTTVMAAVGSSSAATQPVQPEGESHLQTTESNPVSASHFLPDIDQIQDMEAKDIRRILKSRRQKVHPVVPAEQIYGPGVLYMSNPDNQLLQAEMMRENRRRTKKSIEMDLPDDINNPSSPLMRFLSPLAFPNSNSNFGAGKKKSSERGPSSLSRNPPHTGYSSPTSHFNNMMETCVNSPLAPREYSSASNSSAPSRHRVSINHDPSC